DPRRVAVAPTRSRQDEDRRVVDDFKIDNVVSLPEALVLERGDAGKKNVESRRRRRRKQREKMEEGTGGEGDEAAVEENRYDESQYSTSRSDTDTRQKDPNFQF
ncbi:hypothetical protein V2J09_006839, partial [Rumex salicifolius]